MTEVWVIIAKNKGGEKKMMEGWGESIDQQRTTSNTSF